MIVSRSPSSPNLIRSPGETLPRSQRGARCFSSAAFSESSGRLSSDASISSRAPRVRRTASTASETSASASASSVSQGRETAKATPASPGQSIACSQIASKFVVRSSGVIPAKKSRSMARMIFRAPGFHSRNPLRSQVSQRRSNDPAERGSTSSRPSSDSTASRLFAARSWSSSAGAASHSTRSSGRGNSGSIQLKACTRPLFLQFPTRFARSGSDGTRRNSSRISSERSTAEASECASIRTSACGSSRSKFRVIQPAVSAWLSAMNTGSSCPPRAGDARATTTARSLTNRSKLRLLIDFHFQQHPTDAEVFKFRARPDFLECQPDLLHRLHITPDGNAASVL